jgi:hypothetical protein
VGIRLWESPGQPDDTSWLPFLVPTKSHTREVPTCVCCKPCFTFITETMKIRIHFYLRHTIYFVFILTHIDNCWYGR